MIIRGIIFDCDGVLVDSEPLAQEVFQLLLRELEFQLDFKEMAERSAGTSMAQTLELIESLSRKKLPEDFERLFRAKCRIVFDERLQAIPGVLELIKSLKIPFAVASSGPREKIIPNLKATGLLPYFPEHRIFSAYDVQAWKPDPKVFLTAALELEVNPAECIVVEDTKAGIKAALAGGFKTLAYLGQHQSNPFSGYPVHPIREMKEVLDFL
jgi:HAD superfamily hydrolase (TIGR01509 family)